MMKILKLKWIFIAKHYDFVIVDIVAFVLGYIYVNCTNAIFRQVPKSTPPAGPESYSGASWTKRRISNAVG